MSKRPVYAATAAGVALAAVAWLVRLLWHRHLPAAPKPEKAAARKPAARKAGKQT